MAKEKGAEQKAYLMAFKAFACVLAAGLLLVLALVLLRSGKEDETAVLAEVQGSEEDAPGDDPSEDMPEDPRTEPEEEGVRAELPEVKEMAEIGRAHV